MQRLEMQQNLHARPYFVRRFLVLEGETFYADLCNTVRKSTAGPRVQLTVADWLSFWAANSPTLAFYVQLPSLDSKSCLWLLWLTWTSYKFLNVSYVFFCGLVGVLGFGIFGSLSQLSGSSHGLNPSSQSFRPSRLQGPLARPDIEPCFGQWKSCGKVAVVREGLLFLHHQDSRFKTIFITAKWTNWLEFVLFLQRGRGHFFEV